MFDTQLKRNTLTSQRNHLEQMDHMKSISLSDVLSNSQLIQLLSGSTSDAPETPNIGSSQNTSSIPAGLKAKYEQRSGVSMDDVSVHYNSDKPVQYGALAYTQGNDVYLSPGQEQHLGHELGHVIQQKQGRVPVTGSVGGAPLNDDPALEQEADSFLSGNSPVQRVTAGYHPGSGAPIQRLRINLSGDGKDSIRTIYNLRYYKMPTTAGERLFIPDGNHEKVKKTIADHQDELKVNEDIVFEGHGCIQEDDFTTVESLQFFSPQELAEMAASIPKPENWQGKIILFGCRTGDIARQVAEEYYKKTNKSVIVVGPKEEITMVPNFLNLPKSLFGFQDPQKAAALKTDPNFLFLKEIRKIIGSSAQIPLTYLSNQLSDQLSTPKKKVNTVREIFKCSLDPCIKQINKKLKSAPHKIWNHYANLRLKLQSFQTTSELIKQQSQKLKKKISSSKSDDKLITSQIEDLHKLIDLATDLCKEICDDCFQEYAVTFKSHLDFDDKEMMISSTYTAEDERTERALSRLRALFGNNTKYTHNPLISSVLFEIPELFDLPDSLAEWSDLLESSDTK